MIIKVTYIRIILSPNLIAFSCIWILYGGLFDAWPINTEIPGMTLLFLESGMCQSMPFRCLRPGQYLWHKPQVRKNFAVLWQFFMGYLYPPPKKKSKYQSWYLTSCCGLEVQNPTQALKSVKGLGKILDLNPMWERTLPSFGNFAWDIYRVPSPNFFSPNIKVDTLLWAWDE